jgi:hypothetical protein
MAFHILFAPAFGGTFQLGPQPLNSSLHGGVIRLVPA